MLRNTIWIFLLCAAGGPAPQPESLKTVAAYEVPLPSAADKTRFVSLLQKVAQANGYHVDAASPSELEVLSKVSPITFNASVWRGDDDESMASAMDYPDSIGRVWISFPRGEDPSRSTRFRETLIPEIKRVFPGTSPLPIMPNGAIPLPRDLVRTPMGYEVKPSAASIYQDRDE